VSSSKNIYDIAQVNPKKVSKDTKIGRESLGREEINI
jgi:hypothetical protein